MVKVNNYTIKLIEFTRL